MRKILVLLVVAPLAVAATVQSIGQDRLTMITIYDQGGAPDITDRVQFLVGHMPDRSEEAPPRLGGLLAIRPQAGTSHTYYVEARPLHIYVIGDTEEPVVFTVQPGFWGHPSHHRIVLDEAQR